MSTEKTADRPPSPPPPHGKPAVAPPTTPADVSVAGEEDPGAALDTVKPAPPTDARPSKPPGG